MGAALNRLAVEDPTFRVSFNPETGQTIIAGMGELYLDIIVDRLKREFGVNVKTGAPQVAYRETVSADAEGERKYIHQSGGHGQYGHCKITVEPKNRGEGFEFVNAVKAGLSATSFPLSKRVLKRPSKRYYWAIRHRHQSDCLYGELHELTLRNGLQTGWFICIKDAFTKAPHSLELYEVEVNTPSNYSHRHRRPVSRRGQINSTSEATGFTT